MYVCIPRTVSRRLCYRLDCHACPFFQIQIGHQAENHHIASQRDIREIRELVQELLDAFTLYIRTRSTESESMTFQMVVQNIWEVRSWMDNHINNALIPLNRILMKFHPPLPRLTMQRFVRC
jgi:hypothetical protein